MNRKRRGRKEGSIFERGDGLWVASASFGYDADGKRIRRTAYGSSKQEALDKLKTLAVHNAGRVAEADKMTTAQWLDLWLGVVKTKCAPNTHARYEYHIKAAKEYFGHIILRKLEPCHIETAMGLMEQKGATASERLKVVKCVATALKLAVKRKAIPFNPALAVERPSVAEVNAKEGNALNADQAAALLQTSAADRLYAVFAVALDSGARQGELFGLSWDDVDFEKGTIRIRHSLEELRGKHRLKVPKTKKSRRTVLLSPVGLEALRSHRAAMLKEGHIAASVFCDVDGGFLRKSNFYRRTFLPLARKAGLPVGTRFHDLRHTVASLLLQSGVNVAVVSERLGHSNPTITMNIYRHLMHGEQRTAATAIGNILNGYSGSAATSPKVMQGSLVSGANGYSESAALRATVNSSVAQNAVATGRTAVANV